MCDGQGVEVSDRKRRVGEGLWRIHPRVNERDRRVGVAAAAAGVEAGADPVKDIGGSWTN